VLLMAPIMLLAVLSVFAGAIGLVMALAGGSGSGQPIGLLLVGAAVLWLGKLIEKKFFRDR